MKGRPLPPKIYKSCTVIIGEDDRNFLSVIEDEKGNITISALRPTTHKHFDKGKMLLSTALCELDSRKKGTLWTLTAMSSQGKKALLMALNRLEGLPMGQQDIMRLSEIEWELGKFSLFTKVVEPDLPTTAS